MKKKLITAAATICTLFMVVIIIIGSVMASLAAVLSGGEEEEHKTADNDVYVENSPLSDTVLALKDEIENELKKYGKENISNEELLSTTGIRRAGRRHISVFRKPWKSSKLNRQKNIH